MRARHSSASWKFKAEVKPGKTRFSFTPVGSQGQVSPDSKVVIARGE